MQSFSDKPFSLEHWQLLTQQAKNNQSIGLYAEAEDQFEKALREAQKLIDDLSLSASYEHSARLYKTACYNLARVYQLQGRLDDTFHYYQLAYIQIQRFADKPLLSDLTRYCALKVLDTTIVTLLEYYQHSQAAGGQKYSDALISEHVQFMQKHDNKNLPEDLQGNDGAPCKTDKANDSTNKILH